MNEFENITQYDCRLGLDDDNLNYNGYEVVVWAESQHLFELPNWEKHCELINDLEGLETYGSSAFVVESAWLNECRKNGTYPY